MIPSTEPLVSVLTPVYNGADYLKECIESVLAQTYQNYEYLIVNNRSTDQTLDIARSYAAKDKRIRVIDNVDFVDVITNHNIAFNSISLGAKYCKVVSADDFIFPAYLRSTVDLAETHPSVGIVGCYQLSEGYVRWQGFDYPRDVIPGRSLCRDLLFGKQRFVDGKPLIGFGSPTSLLYRADLVRSTKTFYPNLSPHSDTSACFNCLITSDFGFVYQVLSYERIHAQTQTSKSIKINRYLSACLNDVMQYGPYYLSKDELDQLQTRMLNDYHSYLASNLLRGSRGKEFWNYHKGRLAELGFPLKRLTLLKSCCGVGVRAALHPRKAFDRFFHTATI